MVAGDLISAIQSSAIYGDKAKKPPLYGIYNVISFGKNKDTTDQLFDNVSRWKKLIISEADFINIQFMNDSIQGMGFNLDTIKHQISMNSYDIDFVYKIQKSGIMTLSGKSKKDSLHITLKRIDPKDFFLLKRGFHFVNEYPLNR